MAKNNPILIRNEQDEYRQVRHDLIFVMTLNGIFLVLLLALYFYNHSTGRVDAFFSHLLRF